MTRQLTCLILALGAFTFCGVIALCVAVDFAARSDHPLLGRGSADIAVDDIDGAQAMDEVSRGEIIFERNCSGCHSIDGSSRTGPTMEGLYGSTVSMDDGTSVTVDEEYLRQAITDPRRTTRDGYPDVMPAFDGIEGNDLDALVAYIRSLGEGER